MYVLYHNLEGYYNGDVLGILVQSFTHNIEHATKFDDSIQARACGMTLLDDQKELLSFEIKEVIIR